jgi:hypothetical protein
MSLGTVNDGKGTVNDSEIFTSLPQRAVFDFREANNQVSVGSPEINPTTFDELTTTAVDPEYLTSYGISEGIISAPDTVSLGRIIVPVQVNAAFRGALYEIRLANGTTIRSSDFTVSEVRDELNED